VNNTTWLERDRRSDLDPKVLDTMMGKLSPNRISPNFIIPPVACAPICLDQSTRTKLLKELPTLDYIDITVQQVGDQSRGMQILETDTADGQGAPAPVLALARERNKSCLLGPPSGWALDRSLRMRGCRLLWLPASRRRGNCTTEKPSGQFLDLIVMSH
jgi:hypothetical protein